METTRKIARAAWLVPLVYLFAYRAVGLVIGRAAADFLVFILAVAAAIASIYCFARIFRYGRAGILGHAIAGLAVSALILGIWVPNFLHAKTAARAAGGNGQVVVVHVQEDGTILMNDVEVSLDQTKQEFRKLSAAGASIRYSRANPQGDPPPNALEVIRAAADARLRIQMVAGEDP
ncbi:MAG TPA: hypothetical protein VEK57_23475 [Thermoanaerobaculia bacterium]|nr:hypothetical protein [Thermoanaerobaculia bacterium]